MDGKTVIVTGANTGIGKATAMDLAARGAKVILACRSEARTSPAVEEIKAKTKNEKVIFMKLDLASFASIHEFSRRFLENIDQRLDVLINNAGLITSDHEFSEDGIEMTIAVNYFGHFLLTNLLLDRLLASGPGSRIVSVTSNLHNFANPYAFKDFENLKVDGTKADGPLEDPLIFKDLTWIPTFVISHLKQFFSQPHMMRYSNSKLSNILFTRELAKRLKGSGVTTYAVHPGSIVTDIAANRTTGERRDVSILLRQFFKTLVGGAQTTICCAVGDEYANESGLYYAECDPQEVKVAEAHDEELAEKLWTWSEKVVGFVRTT